jgi:hypothetical protein
MVGRQTFERSFHDVIQDTIPTFTLTDRVHTKTAGILADIRTGPALEHKSRMQLLKQPADLINSITKITGFVFGKSFSLRLNPAVYLCTRKYKTSDIMIVYGFRINRIT